MTSRTKTLASLGAATVLVVGLVGAPVLAQAGDDATDAPAVETTTHDAQAPTPPADVEERHADREARRAERRQAFVDALAEELGISSEELQAAMEAVREDLRADRLTELEARLEEKVAAGELTQEQADAILERAESGEWPRRRGHRGHGPSGGFGPGAGPAGALLDGDPIGA
ncbi:MAG: hypothetical protein ACLGIR_00455 [Actinomycetes bacterium]